MPTREQKAIQYWKEEKVTPAKKKSIKKTRQKGKPRRRDWMGHVSEDPDAWDEIDYEADQHILSKGSGESPYQETVDAMEEEEGAQPVEAGRPAESRGLVEGLVVEMGSGLCRVNVAGETLLCSMRGSLSAGSTSYTNVVAVGDRVLVREGGEEGQGVVEQVLPRESVLARPDVIRPQLNQVIVANAQQLLIVAAWREPKIWLELIDRYLITAMMQKLEPIICLNKVDLAEDMEECQYEMEPYEELGYRVIYTSALEGDGVDEVREVLRDKMTVLAGLSGVGKSALLSAVQPGLNIKVGEVSDYYKQGQHTTTQVNLFPLKIGGYVVDTPGIREFGLSGLYREELAQYYPEFATVGRCRFSNCQHLEEPGCAVKQAVEEDRLSVERYLNYIKIYETLTAYSL